MNGQLKRLLTVSAVTLFFAASASAREHGRDPASMREVRVAHARELLGKYYNASVVKTGEQVKEVSVRVSKWTRESLPKADRAKHKKISQTILAESRKHGFDPIFVVSVIMSESGFNPRSRGSAGEIGLMQLLPKTAEWIAHREKIRWKGAKTLLDPITNIRLGTAYLAYLRERFDSHARLYLAAYNMGQGNVEQALERHIWPKDYPIRIMEKYVALYSQLRRPYE